MKRGIVGWHWQRQICVCSQLWNCAEFQFQVNFLLLTKFEQNTKEEKAFWSTIWKSSGQPSHFWMLPDQKSDQRQLKRKHFGCCHCLELGRTNTNSNRISATGRLSTTCFSEASQAFIFGYLCPNSEQEMMQIVNWVIPIWFIWQTWAISHWILTQIKFYTTFTIFIWKSTRYSQHSHSLKMYKKGKSIIWKTLVEHCLKNIGSQLWLIYTSKFVKTFIHYKPLLEQQNRAVF